MSEHRMAEQVAYCRSKTPAGGYRLGEAAYNALWLSRVRRRVQIDSSGCWLWLGQMATNGYGQTSYRGKTGPLSRWMYQAWHGVKLHRLQYVCHSCDVKQCCNPEHLWLGNNGLNKRDETSKGKNYWANRTHCPKGHPYDEANTYTKECRPGVLSRSCKACALERTRRYWIEKPEYMRERQRKYRARRKGASA